MKRVLVSIAILVAVSMVFTGSVFAASAGKITELPDLKIVVEGKLAKCQNIPILVNGSTLLPLRELAAILGVQNDDRHIIYDGSNKSVTILKDDTKIVVYIGKLNAYINDKSQQLSTVPIIYGKGSTYIPFRFVAEALGKKVIWDAKGQSVLICDPVRYDKVKTIMDKVETEFAKVGKYKMDMDIFVNVKSEDVGTKMGISAASDVDMTNKKMHMLMDMDILGMQIKTESYYADNVSYTKKPLLGTWTKQTYLKPDYDKVFASESNGEVFKSDDTLCAGLNEVQSTNANEILLKGDVFNSTLYDTLMDQEGLGEDEDISDDIGSTAFTIEVSIDRSTYLVNSIDMSMKSEGSEDDQKILIDMTSKTTYSEYNGSFEITVPEEAVKNALETKSPTLLNPKAQ